MKRKELKDLIERYREAKASTEAAGQKIDEMTCKVEKARKKVARLERQLNNSKKRRDRVLDDLASGAATDSEYFAVLNKHKKVHDASESATFDLREVEEVLDLLRQDRAMLTSAAYDAAVRLAEFVVANRSS